METVDSGLYRCEIPDKNNVTQTFYVGIYPDDEDELEGEEVPVLCNDSV